MDKEAISYQEMLNAYNAMQLTRQMGTAKAREAYKTTITSPQYNTLRDIRSKDTKSMMGTKLPPGVYAGSRIVRDAPLGRHQFIMMIPENPEAVPPGLLKDLGGGNTGVIAGAYNVVGEDGKRYLKYVPNHDSDVSSARSFFTGKGDKKWLPEIVPTQTKHSIDSTINDILTKGNNYAFNEATHKPMNYPPVLQNALGTGINSNTFTQNMLEGAEVKQTGKLSGYGPGAHLTMDNSMFNQLVPDEVTALKTPKAKPATGGTLHNIGKVLKMFKKADELDKTAFDYSKLIPPTAVGVAGLAPAIASYAVTRDKRNIFSKQNVGNKLQPGIYMGARRLRGPVPFGRHQFIIMIPENVENYPGMVKDLGGGNRGMIVGAYKKDTKLGEVDRLRYSRNDKYDLKAARSYFEGDDKTWRTEIIPTTLTNNLDTSIQSILDKGKAYRMNERYRKNIDYPGMLTNALNKGINSNSFAQSIAQSSGVKPVGSFARYSPGQQFDVDTDMFAPRKLNIEERADKIYETNPDNPEDVINPQPIVPEVPEPAIADGDIPVVPIEDKPPITKVAKHLLHIMKEAECGKPGCDNKIPGGLADNKTPADFDKNKLQAGIKVEKEHTSDDSIATEIAMDHLTEDNAYYDKLKTIENHKEAGVAGDMAWELSKVIPLYGAIPSGVDTVKHLGKGQFGSAALDALGTGLALIPDPGTGAVQAGISGARVLKMLNTANKANKARKAAQGAAKATQQGSRRWNALKQRWEKVQAAGGKAYESVRNVDRKVRKALPTAKPLEAATTNVGKGWDKLMGAPGRRFLKQGPDASYNRARNVMDAAWWGGQSAEALHTSGEARRKQAIMEALQRQAMTQGTI